MIFSFSFKKISVKAARGFSLKKKRYFLAARGFFLFLHDFSLKISNSLPFKTARMFCLLAHAFPNPESNQTHFEIAGASKFNAKLHEFSPISRFSAAVLTALINVPPRQLRKTKTKITKKN